MNDTFIGVDLGQAADYTAVSVLKRSMVGIGPAGPELSFDIPHLHRYHLGTPYPVIARDLKDLIAQVGHCHLVADATGVGRPVLDMLREHGLQPIGITITGGNEVTEDEFGGFHVPKRDLVSTCSVLLQNRRLRIAARLPHAKTLEDELLNFKAKITLKGNDTYGAEAPWREGNHDDLVLSVCVAAWLGCRLFAGQFVTGPVPQPAPGYMRV